MSWTNPTRRAQEAHGDLTADHGNAEQMIDPVSARYSQRIRPTRLPVILIGNDQHKLMEGGSLRDIAPTMLGILGLRKPEEMTGQDLRRI